MQMLSTCSRDVHFLSTCECFDAMDTHISPSELFFVFLQTSPASQHVGHMETHQTSDRAVSMVQSEKSKTHSLFAESQVHHHFLGASFNPKTCFKTSKKLPGATNGGQRYKKRSMSWASPLGEAALTSAVKSTQSSRVRLAPSVNSTGLVSHVEFPAHPDPRILEPPFLPKPPLPQDVRLWFAFTLSTITNLHCNTILDERCLIWRN